MDRIVISAKDEVFLNEISKKFTDAGNVLDINVPMLETFEMYLEQPGVITTFSKKMIIVYMLKLNLWRKAQEVIWYLLITITI